MTIRRDLDALIMQCARLDADLRDGKVSGRIAADRVNSIRALAIRVRHVLTDIRLDSEPPAA